jgi:predicted ArsR family transcriptional regulator
MTSSAKPPVRERIPSVLALQPMTVEQLAKCLSVHPHTIRRALPLAGVRRAGTERSNGRPWIRYEVAA